MEESKDVRKEEIKKEAKSKRRVKIIVRIRMLDWQEGKEEFDAIGPFSKNLEKRLNCLDIRFSLVGFYGISPIVGYSMPNPL